MELEPSSLRSPMGQHRALVWSPSDVSPNFKTRCSKTFRSESGAHGSHSAAAVSSYNAKMVGAIAEVLQGFVSPWAWTSSAAGYPVLQRSGWLQRDWLLFYTILWSEYSLT